MSPITLCLIFSLLVPSYAHLLQLPADQPFISFLISEKGLNFLKEFLITNAVSSITPLKLPPIQKTSKIPVVGKVNMILSNITIYEINVQTSYVKPGETGVLIDASGTTCNLSMNWNYSYTTWLVPVAISDRGRASVQVEGMEVGLSIGLKNEGGALKLSLLECGSHIKDISIKLEGGASWLYQGMIDAFVGKIESAVEKAITEKLHEGVSKLDFFLQSLPREIFVDEIASLNVTFVNDPLLSNSSIELWINGLFTKTCIDPVLNRYDNSLQPSIPCTDPSKMLQISLDQAVFTSASSLYFDADFMHWIVNKIPDQALLNTAGWRFVIPQLYKKYPDDDMNLNISLSSAPVIRISSNNVHTTAHADVILDVLEGNDVIPVACISLVIQASGLVKISQNNLVGSVRLNDFTMSLKWSNIGNLRMYLIQPVMWTFIETVFLPYVNARLGKGFPLPIIHGFMLQNAEVICSDSTITACSDVTLAESYGYSRPALWT